MEQKPNAVRRVLKINGKIIEGRGKVGKRRLDAVKNDIQNNGVCKNMVKGSY